MSYHFTAIRKPTYIHAIGTGEQSAANARQFLLDAYRACVEHDVTWLLVEMAFTGRSLGMGAIYGVIADRSPDGMKLDRIAYVDTNPEQSGDPAEFAELVARNRGVNVRLFPNVVEAERWLSAE